ncbi:glycosyltransferase family 9 protein [Ruficoccus sp. ZRK36]|uniref:glycosyltransferase family 9 protein n=1 Tax=Ruficoccus sp. ZRK36 TaxID=2866311 RepID=UPI001C72FB5B|nr:glycosyltransferase family 9 protein [Ruficoccus sp. ZRK36]QYY37391.1 hypothetical protein K0V07_07865 [Ruficoccus sp. ZRK36]
MLRPELPGAASAFYGRILNAVKWLRRIKSQRAYNRLRGHMPGAEATRAYKRVIFKPDRLGDLLLSSASIRAACGNHPPEQCLLIVSEVAEPLAEILLPGFPRLAIPFDCRPRKEQEKCAKIRAQLSAIACDELICLRHQRSDFFSLCLSWIQAKSIHALALPSSQDEDWLRKSESGWLKPLVFTPPTTPTQPTELYRHLAVLSQISPAPANVEALLPQMPAPEDTNATLIVSPLGSEPIRDIPPELLLQLVAPFTADRIDLLRLCGSPSQENKLTELAAFLREKRPDLKTEVSCRASLKAFVEQVGQAHAVVSTDTFTAHLATALDKRAFIVLAGGQFGQWGPWTRSARQVWLHHRLPCYGCDWECPYPVPRCVHEIDVRAFAEQMRTALDT